MRLAGLTLAAALATLAAHQFLNGGASDGRAGDAIALTESDICLVEAATQPVIVSEEREFVTTPAHKMLSVTPAQFGTRIETVTVVPEHQEGATFLDERKRVIVSEPTRRLRPVDPVFGPDVVVEARSVTRYRVENGVLVETTEDLPPLPEQRIVTGEPRIQAVRINAGLRMLEIKVVDEEGEGDLVPAETVEIEVKTVEAQPKVEATDIPATVETAMVEVLKTPAERREVEALCTPTERLDLVRKVQDVLAARNIETGDPGAWTPATIDALAAAQAEETGLVAPALLLETLRAWVPDVMGGGV